MCPAHLSQVPSGKEGVAAAPPPGGGVLRPIHTLWGEDNNRWVVRFYSSKSTGNLARVSKMSCWVLCYPLLLGGPQGCRLGTRMRSR